MFKKSMIALAVMAMATGVQAETINGNTQKDTKFDEVAADFIVQGGYIGHSEIDINAQNITVTNPSPMGPQPVEQHGIYAVGSVKLNAAKDITIHSNYLGIYVAGQEVTDKNKPAKVDITAGGTLTVKTESGWAIKNEKGDGYNWCGARLVDNLECPKGMR